MCASRSGVQVPPAPCSCSGRTWQPAALLPRSPARAPLARQPQPCSRVTTRCFTSTPATRRVVSGRRRSARLRTACSSVNASGSAASAAAPRKSSLSQFLLDQFVPIGLIVAIAVGVLFPGPGAAAAQYGLLRAATTGIFLISGLGLRRGEALKALSAWPAIVFASTSILLLTPWAGLAALALPLQPRELSLGLAVFCCMPTTLSSGVSLTNQCGGNGALALLLTVGTNLAAIVTLPFMLLAVVGPAMAGVRLQPVELIASLVQTILVPLLAGVALRAFVPGVAGWVDRNKRATQLASGALLCSTPWTQVSSAVLGGAVVTLPALALLAAASVGLHLALLAFNTAAASLLQLGGTGPEAPRIRRAVILCASQKTLPVAVALLYKLGASGALGAAAGVAVIPCVLSHMLQIVVDSVLVSRWIKADRAAAAGGVVEVAGAG